MDIENRAMQQEFWECTKNLAVIKIILIGYLLFKQFGRKKKHSGETLIYKNVKNIQIFLIILWNKQFLSHQGLDWRNNNEDDFEQLMKLSATVDPRTTSWMEKKQGKYFHHDIQNEFIRLMVFIILRDIAKN